MFIGLTKALGKSKIRIGAGVRITKNNIWYMLFFLLLYYAFLMCWYCIVLSFWIIYAMIYGCFILIRWIVRKIKTLIISETRRRKNEDEKDKLS